jgi:ABC-type enterochelin transport system ATPase subunit
VSQPTETYGLEQSILHHSYKKMAGKTVRIPCRERTHLSGDNGAGKTTILSLIPVFFGDYPIIDAGEAMVVGDSVLLPSRIKIEPPKKTFECNLRVLVALARRSDESRFFDSSRKYTPTE